MPPNTIRVLIAESIGFSSKAAELLGRVAEVVLADLDRGRLQALLKEADVLWVRLRNRIDSDIMRSAPRLKVIVTPTTGLNHIDLDEARRRNVRILSLQGENEFLRDVRATAEHTLALMLALLRHVPPAVAHVREGGWNRDLFKGRELHGKTVGIVGYGRLGRIVGRYLRAFDAQVLAADPHIDATSVEAGVTLVGLNGLLRVADLVSLHADLSDETRGFFGSEQFALMKPGAWFVNTSRGELIDETALLEGLQSGRLAGAALDVLLDEQADGMKGHPLVAYAREHDNLIITPHIGGCTSESMEATEVFLAERLVPLVQGLARESR